MNKSNTVTIQTKSNSCICPGDRPKVIEPLAHHHHS